MKWLLITLLTPCVLSACKPEKPDVVETRREAAQARLESAQEAAGSTHAGRKLATELKKGESDAVIVRIGEKTITVGDVARAIDSKNVEMRARYMSPSGRRKLVEEMVEQELMVAEAEKQGLGRHPSVQYAWKKAMVDLYVKDLARGIRPGDIPDAEARTVFEARPGDYQHPERRRAAVLIVGTVTKAENIRAELMLALSENKGARVQTFSDFVKRYTEHKSTKLVNGDLGWFDAKGTPDSRRIRPEISSVDEAFKLGLEEVSKVFSSEGGAAIVQVTGIKPAKAKSFASVRLDIKLRLLEGVRQKERSRLIKELVSAAKIDINEAALKTVDAPAKATPPAPRVRPKGHPYLPTLRRPRVTNPRALQGQKPLERTDRKPSMDTEEILNKMKGSAAKNKDQGETP